ncbi:hypothetical protein ABZP36_004431 [Zizania latifolia]
MPPALQLQTLSSIPKPLPLLRTQHAPHKSRSVFAGLPDDVEQPSRCLPPLGGPRRWREGRRTPEPRPRIRPRSTLRSATSPTSLRMRGPPATGRLAMRCSDVTVKAASEEVDSIYFSVYNEDEIKRISVKQITKSDRLDAKNCPVPGGLLDPALGPTNDNDTSLIQCRIEHSVVGICSRIGSNAHLKLDDDDFKEEQNSVARLIHMLHNDDHEEMLKVWTPCSLAGADERFRRYSNTLFSETSLEVNRERLTSKENDKLNKSISSYLRLLASYLQFPVALKTLEYLIRRYLVHVYNLDELLLSALPYHIKPKDDCFGDEISIDKLEKCIAELVKHVVNNDTDALNARVLVAYFAVF